MAAPALDPRLANLEWLRFAGGVRKLKKQRAAQQPDTTRTALFRPLPLDPMAWLTDHFATYFQTPDGMPVPMAPHHEEFWRWVWGLIPGMPSRTFLAILARRGGKSTQVELASAVAGYFGLRRYGIYVCGTQQQSDDHVANVASALELLGVERSVNKYGYSRGWRVNRLETEDGFTMDGIGLDTASSRGRLRGVYRPDFIALDELDNERDTSLTTQKKIWTLTQSILPTGSSALAVVGVQNIPNKDGIFAQLADGRADFLHDRYLSGPHPALLDLPASDWYRLEPQADGPTRIRLTAGRPSWVGQDIAACESLLTLIGVRAFLIECQHLVHLIEGELFRREWFPIVEDWPRDARLVRAWDFAGTELKPGTDPDWTVGILLAEHRGRFWVLDMQRMRGTPLSVKDLVRQSAALDGRHVTIWLEEEGGSSGKAVTDDFQRNVLAGYSVYAHHPTGDKLIRAKPVSSAAEAGNVALVAGAWNKDFLDELCLLGLPGVHDDLADALSLGHFALTSQAPLKMW